MSEKIVLSKDQAEKLDEIKQLLKESDLTIEDIKKYFDKGYTPRKIGFI